MKRLRTVLPAILCGPFALLLQTADAATHTWFGQSGQWNSSASWTTGGIPPLNNTTTELIFGGSVQTGAYVSDNNLGPIVLNRIILRGSDTDNANSGLQHVIQNNVLRFAGINPEIRQEGSANITFTTPIRLNGSLLFSGSGPDPVNLFPPPGTVTLNGGVSGVGDIRKIGASTFRFGTLTSGLPAQTPSANTWMGNLIIEEGVIRFNNNAQAASSALRANPVVFTGDGTLSSRRDNGDQTDGFETSLRMGTLSSENGFGRVHALVEGSGSVNNYDIVITALTDGTYSGEVLIPSPLGAGNDGGDFVVRGSGIQTLTGNLKIWKDTVIGHGATLSLAGGNGSLYNFENPNAGAVILAGGTLRLDNTTPTFVNQGRLRNGDATNTTVDTIGGGTVQLVGNAGVNGTTELTGRLQLGAPTNPRSGHAKLEVVAPVGALGITNLSFQSYSRNQTTVPQFATAEFSAIQNGNFIQLGGAAGKVFLTTNSVAFTVPLVNGLLSTTGGAASVGWATANGPSGPQFATHGANGVAAITPVPWTTFSANPSPTTNVQLSGSASTTGAATATMNSLRLQAAGVNAFTLNIGADTLSTTAILLAGAADYVIAATGGKIGGNGTRFFHVPTANLTVEAGLDGTAQPVVKSGDGTLTLTANNSSLNQIMAINGGAVRATQGTTLPQGEIRLRGGQLELQGGGTFSRSLGFGANTINWSGVQLTAGVPNEVDQDRGSGGFAAAGGDVDIDLDNAGPTLISWEGLGFLRSGFGLVFGSRTATHRVTWTDNLSLSASDLTVVNYNAREIRVLNNPVTPGDYARITGAISGRQTNDLLKTGPGDLELTATNTYSGATIIREGRLYVNGSSQSSFLHKAMAGGTLAGKGSVGPVLVDAGGTVAPGLTSGVASVLTTKDLQFTDATSKFLFEIGGTSAGGDGTTGYDQISALDAAGATITLNGATLEGTFLNGYLAGFTDIFFLILNDGTDAVVGQFAQGNLVTIGSQNFNISYTANSDTGLFSGGNDVALQLVPEPSSVLLLGLGTLLVARRRRSAA